MLGDEEFDQRRVLPIEPVITAEAPRLARAEFRVIAAFAALVGSERRLTALYLLTVADIRGTSPKVWNAWKGKLLEIGRAHV